jgi:O-antigen/teichoic acid export membrane protein
MWKKLKELLFDSAIYGASDILAKVIGFILLPLFTRYLTQAEYGVLAMFAFIKIFFVPIANLGMTNAIFRRFSLAQDSTERTTILSTGLTSVTTASALLGLVVYYSADLLNQILTGDAIYIEVCKIAVITATISSVGAIPLVILRADRRVTIVAILNIIKLILALSVSIYLVIGQEQGIAGIVWGNLIAELVALLAGFYFILQDFKFQFSKNIWQNMLDYGLPFLPHRLFVAGSLMFGQYSLRIFLGLEELGIYSIAVRFAMPVTFMVTAIQKAWVPFKFQVYAEDENPGAVLSSMVTYYMVTVSYLWVGISCWAPELIKLILPSHFHQSAYLIAFVSAVPLSSGLFFMFGSGFGLKQDTKSLPLISLSGLIAVILCSIALIPEYGGQGAAIASALGWLTMTRLFYAAAQNLYKIDYDWVVLAPCAVASISIVTISFYLLEHQAIYRIGLNTVATIGYPAFIIFLMIQSRKESSRVNNLFKFARSRIQGGP